METIYSNDQIFVSFFLAIWIGWEVLTWPVGAGTGSQESDGVQHHQEQGWLFIVRNKAEGET